MNETTFGTEQHTSKSARRQKSTSDRLKDKLKQLNKAKASLKLLKRKLNNWKPILKNLKLNANKKFSKNMV